MFRLPLIVSAPDVTYSHIQWNLSGYRADELGSALDTAVALAGAAAVPASEPAKTNWPSWLDKNKQVHHYMGREIFYVDSYKKVPHGDCFFTYVIPYNPDSVCILVPIPGRWRFDKPLQCCNLAALISAIEGKKSGEGLRKCKLPKDPHECSS